MAVFVSLVFSDFHVQPTNVEAGGNHRPFCMTRAGERVFARTQQNIIIFGTNNIIISHRSTED